MKNGEILLLVHELPTVSPPNMEGWFNYAIEETLQRAEQKAKSIRKVIEPKEKMAEYQDLLKKIQERFCNKDEYGKPIKKITKLSGGKVFEQYEIPESEDPKSLFSVAVKDLSDEYKKDIEEYEKGLDFLDEENNDFEPFWITAKQIPDGLSRNQMKAVFLMIKKDAEAKA